jgi:hypothetical protein
MGTGLVTRDASEADFDGYPANLKPGYRISGAGRMPDIRPDFKLNIQISSNIRYETIKDIRCITYLVLGG